MATFRTWPATNGPGSVTSDSTGYALGVEFYVTAAASLGGFWFWCATGANTSAKSFQLWQVVTATSGNAITGTAVTSGTLTPGTWNFVALPSPVALTINQRYRAAVHFAGGSNWYSSTGSGFPADIVNGPLTTVSTANATGGLNGTFIVSATMDYPRSSGGSNYWVDVSVDTGAASGDASRTIAGTLTATGTRSTTGAASLAVTAGVAAAGVVGKSAAASLTAAAALTATGDAAPPPVLGDASHTTTAALTAAGTRTARGDAPALVAATLTAAGTIVAAAAGGLPAVAALTSSGRIATQAGGSLTPAAGLTAAGFVTGPLIPGAARAGRPAAPTAAAGRATAPTATGGI